MPNLNITPQTVLLTSGQAVTFAATNADGQPVSASWSLNPPAIGTLVTTATGGSSVTPAPAVGAPAASVTYVAPQVVSSAQTVAMIASTASGSASATISLTPIAIVPAQADLKAGQLQPFQVVFAPVPAGAPAEKITWILSPPFGRLDPEPGSSDDRTRVYKAPKDIPDSTTVNVIAATTTPGKLAVAAISLSSPPWQGAGVNFLGGYLILVFSLVFLMVGLWPPALPSPDTARANRIEAEKILDDKTTTLQNAEVAAAKATEEKTALEAKKAALEKSSQAQSTGASATKMEEISGNLETANAKATAAAYVLQRAREARKYAEKDLDKKRNDEAEVNRTDVHTWLAGYINRELDLLWLVLLAGCLGSFLHMAQSYSDFIGNRTIKSSWAWWYSFRPFIGAGLALVLYASVRGGFMAVTTGSNAKASELNPFGLVALGALVGMFSKAATMKLGEVFDTLFKSDKAKESKDKLASSPQTSNQPAGKPPAGGTTASSAAK